MNALRRTLWGSVLGLGLLLGAGHANAFTHIVQPGDTLASLAERFYGKIQHERLLVAANSLEMEGGIRITPGLLLEIPALTYIKVSAGQTWKQLALRFLGGEHRAHALAQANDSQAWLLPPTDSEIAIPYNLRYVATGNETVVGLAYRYLGDRRKAWMLDQYNQRKGRRLERGEVVLIPVTDLALTEPGKQAAALAQGLSERQLGGAAMAAQKQVETELGMLEDDVRHARYVEVVERGIRCLSLGELSEPQRARIHRFLLEAYTALDARELAHRSCVAWLENDRQAKLDPTQHSPKILAACESSSP